MHLPDSILSKIFKAEELQQELSQKRPGQKVVFTNGCFDIIHLGHLHLLSSAREMGDLLVVGLNTDDSVKRLKGNDRPVKDQETRALVLASMEFVDYVVLFDEDTPMELIRTLGPDVLVKGGDYAIHDIVGADFIIKNGGEVRTVPYLEGYSTTSLLDGSKKS